MQESIVAIVAAPHCPWGPVGPLTTTMHHGDVIVTRACPAATATAIAADAAIGNSLCSAHCTQHLPT